jgi:hypothetical protein
MARGGRSLVGIGTTTGSVTVAAGATVIVTYTIDEPGVLDRFMLSQFDLATGAPLLGITVDAMNLDNDNLISGIVGGNIFTDQTQSPYLGHRVTQNTKLRVTFGNPTGVAIQVNHGFSVR